LFFSRGGRASLLFFDIVLKDRYVFVRGGKGPLLFFTLYLGFSVYMPSLKFFFRFTIIIYLHFSISSLVNSPRGRRVSQAARHAVSRP
jgi:hypothetical protein